MEKLKAKVFIDDAKVIERLTNGDLAKYNEENFVVLPGLCDVHVHFREPGFSYKETIKTGSMASAKGGFTAVCTMPNLNPVPDSVDNLNKQLEIIRKDAVIKVYPYASITKLEQGKELVDMPALADKAVAFSDDGKGVQDGEMMLCAMRKAKELDKIIAAHCEDNSLLFGGYVHKGDYAKEHGHLGICSESEYKQIERDLKLVKETGVKYHVCHISTKESVEVIRQAKKDGLDVTCETGPHYLILDDSNLKEDGWFKMNPPLRSKTDRLALIEGLKDGTIDMIATDHAPHSIEEKSRGLEKSAFGVVGIETSFSAMYTHLVKTGIITLDDLVKVMSTNPRNRFKLDNYNDFTIFDLSKDYVVNPDEFVSMGKATPFKGMTFTGVCVYTSVDGKTVYTK